MCGVKAAARWASLVNWFEETTVQLLQGPSPDAANEPLWPLSRTAPIAQTLVPVPGYPRKLVLFKMAASRFWQVRCWVHGKSYRRSTRSKSLRVAQESAKQLYESLLSQPHELFDPVPTVSWAQAAQHLLEHEQARVRRGEFSMGSWQVLRNRLIKTLNPLWGEKPLDRLGAREVMELVHQLSQYLTPTTVHQHVVIVRKVFGLAKRMGWLTAVPDVPSIKVKGQSRGAFKTHEYERIVRESRRLVGQVHPSSLSELRQHMRLRQADTQMPVDLSWAIRLLVNGFMRPSDLKYLKHQHVEVVLSGTRSYLRLTLPETKGHGTPIVTMPAAVHVFRHIVSQRPNNSAPSDYLLLPHISDRDHALKVLGVHFNWVLQNTGLKRSPTGTQRSLYSLRHSAITFRLLYGSGVDLLTLARNARTSVQMIERHYASTLQAEQNIAMLHSRR
jgi:integrase